MYQIIMLYTLNIYILVVKYTLMKTGKKFKIILC